MFTFRNIMTALMFLNVGMAIFLSIMQKYDQATFGMTVAIFIQAALIANNQGLEK